MGIVGGLIVGSAAVEANLVSPIVVMVVAITALGSLAIPNEEFASAFRLLKYFFLFLGGISGDFWNCDRGVSDSVSSGGTSQFQGCPIWFPL